MRVFSWFFFLLVLGLVGFLAYKIERGTQGDPEALVAEAQRLAGSAEPDLPAAIDKLNFALRTAQGDPIANHDMIGSILAARGALFGDMGQYAQARIDLERVLKNYKQDDADVQVDLAAVMLETEDHTTALDITQSVLSASPRRADAWTLQSRALVALADEVLTEANEVCEDALPDKDELKAAEILDRITSLELDSPARVNYLFQLRELFGLRDQGRLRDVLRLSDQASEYVTEARTALAESFREQPTRDSLYDFQTLLRRAGRKDLAVDFGLAAINRRTANANVDFVRNMLEDLLEFDRPHTGVDIVNLYYNRSVLPDPGFYAAWSESLYRDESWSPLLFVAQSMRNASLEEEPKALANLYMGLAHVEQDQFYEAPNALVKYINSPVVVDFEDADVMANLALALCYRQLDQSNQEKAALRGALKDMTDEHPEAGSAWLRLSELITETEPNSTKEAFEALTHAIRLSPDRVDELMPRWRKQGNERLQLSRANLTLTYQTLLTNGQLVPEGNVEPFELVRLAEMYDEEGKVAGVAGCSRKFLLRYPGFLPVVDMYIGVARRNSDPELLARLLIERMKYTGPEPETLRELNSLPTNLMTLETRTELMRRDPEHTGRLALVRDLKAKGRSLEALAGLNLVPEEQLNDEGRLLEAQLAHDLGRWGLADTALKTIPKDSPFYSQSLELRLDIGVATTTRKPLEALIDEIVTSESPNVDFLLKTADRMMLNGLENYARLLLQRLDQRDDTRSGDVMFRRAIATWLNENAIDTEGHLARAQAYQIDGGPELGWLIRAVDLRNWDDLPWLVADLQTSRFDPTLQQAAILDVLREEPGAAEDIVARGVRQNPDDPIWHILHKALDLTLQTTGSTAQADGDADADLLYLLAGLGGGDRDPRQLLVRLLAMEHPGWLVWTAMEFEDTKLGEEGGLWSTYLAAACRERLGDLEKSEALARAILDEHKAFIPAWDLLERVTLAGVDRPNHPRYVRVQLSRQRNFSDRAQLGSRDYITAANAKVQEGDTEEAVALLEQALELEPDNVDALSMLGGLRRQRLEWQAAIEVYSHLVSVIEPEPGNYLVYEYLDLLDEAAAARTDLHRTVFDHAETMTLRMPTDPRVALTRAKRELESGPNIPEIRLGRAFKRLNDFRDNTEHRRLEDLAPGSTRPWVDFFILHDPVAAHRLVQSELEKAPDSLDHWHMLGESYAALGQRKEAVEVFEFLQRMLPDSRTTRALAHLVSQTGKDTDAVSKLCSRTIQLERIRSRDIDLQIAVARSLVNNLGTNARDRGIELLQGLWSKRSRAKDSAQVAEIGMLYGLALSWRADTKDRNLANDVLMEVEPLIDDPAERHMIRAVANLALTMSRQR